MRAINKAIEDASDFGAFRDALTRPMPRTITAQEYAETRTLRRKRERAERKAAKKQPKVRA
jgi:hypothetical protein